MGCSACNYEYLRLFLSLFNARFGAGLDLGLYKRLHLIYASLVKSCKIHVTRH